MPEYQISDASTKPIAASRSAGARNVGMGSWPCGNAEAGSLAGPRLQCSVAPRGLRAIFCRFRLQRKLTRPLASRAAPGPARTAKVRAHHALTAAIIGLTPKIFSTRVKL